MTQNTPSRFGLVGTGWRADFFLRLAAALPDRFEVAAVATRDPAKGAAIEKAWSVPTVRNASDLIRSYQPDFVVASVNRVATPEVIETCVRQGTPVLAETPPALDRAAMRELWQRLARPELVQVAEQYPYLPKLQAFQALIAAGRLGDVTAAEVSWTHGYHAVAMLRGLLGAEFREVTVTAQGDLEGFDLDTITLGSDVLYRNPFQGARLSDEDIAIATVLDRMSDWVRGAAEPPYPLAQACQDHLLALAIAEAAKESRPVMVGREAWATP